MSRRAGIDIEYEGKNITNRISSLVESFKYVDPAEGESDSISLTLSNIDKRWINTWMPENLDKIKASILKTNVYDIQKKYLCGLFTIDDLSFSGRPLIMNIGAVSIPANSEFKTTKKTRTWSGISIMQIGVTIAAEAGITLVFDVEEDTLIDSIEQSDENDCTFLTKLCDSYGLCVKVYYEKIVIYNDEVYENKVPVATLTEKDLDSWDYNASIQGTYTGATLTYSDPDSDVIYSASVGDGTRILELNEKVSSNEEAEKVAISKVNKENKNMITMTITPKEPLFICACTIIIIKGLSKIDGNYFVTKVTHSISNGYTQSIGLRKIVERIKKQAVKTATSGTSYTIKKNDTLFGLSKKFYHTPSKAGLLYETNKDVIEAAAQSHGRKNSDNGHWIYPGTVLMIPDA